MSVKGPWHITETSQCFPDPHSREDDEVLPTGREGGNGCGLVTSGPLCGVTESGSLSATCTVPLLPPAVNSLIFSFKITPVFLK